MFDTLKDSNPIILLAGVILIPVSVAAISLWVDTRIDDRQRELAERVSARQERLAATQMLDTYFQGVGELFARQMAATMRDRIIVARTRSLLQRLLIPQDLAVVVRFVAELRPELLRRPARVIDRVRQPFIDLSGLNLSGADLSFANLYRADLDRTDLRGSDLSWANLTEATLKGARLDQAKLLGTDLNGANLTGASLIQARLGGASLNAATLSGADLRNADLSDLEFDGIRTAVDFRRARLDHARWLDGQTCGPKAVGLCQQIEPATP